MALFLLKKVITPFFYPLTVTVIMSALGIFFFVKRARRKGIFFSILAFIFLLGISCKPLTNTVVLSLEKAYPPLKAEKIKDLPQVKYICVLGGGYNLNPEIPANSVLSHSSLMRLVEAVRLYRHLPHSRVIVSGGAVYTTVPEALILHQAGEMLGLPREKIIIEDRARDTAEQARLIKAMVKDAPIVIVTSAMHMRRSMLLFEREGMKPIPAPTDYRSEAHTSNPIRAFFPSPESIQNLEQAIHEYLGLAWLKISH